MSVLVWCIILFPFLKIIWLSSFFSCSPPPRECSLFTTWIEAYTLVTILSWYTIFICYFWALLFRSVKQISEWYYLCSKFHCTVGRGVVSELVLSIYAHSLSGSDCALTDGRGHKYYQSADPLSTTPFEHGTCRIIRTTHIQ